MQSFSDSMWGCLFSPAPDVCGRPCSDHLCTLASHGACARMGNFCLGGTDSLLWPLRALQGGDDQDLRSFCFRPRGFVPFQKASSGQKVCRWLWHWVPFWLSSVPEPMQLGGGRISVEERQRRILNRLCLYCGAAGHFASSCLLKARARQ